MVVPARLCSKTIFISTLFISAYSVNPKQKVIKIMRSSVSILAFKKAFTLLGLILLPCLLSQMFIWSFSAEAAHGAMAGTILHVDAKSTAPAPDGVGWDTAFSDLQMALAAAPADSEIWVAAGVYTPGTTVTNTFALTDTVAIYGGFTGADGLSETIRSQRNWEANVTVLSGDIDSNDATDSNGVVTTTTGISGTNSYHVVTGSGVTNTAVLDGFIITAGSATGPSASNHNQGGGVYNQFGSPTLSHVAVIGNRGANAAGMLNRGSHLIMDTVIISGNAASNFGGGMLNISQSIPVLKNVIISENSATNGGGIYNSINSHSILSNVTIRGNLAQGAGGGIYNSSTSNPVLSNVTIQGNASLREGGGIYNELNSNPKLTNVVVSGNSAQGDGGGIYQVFGGNLTLINVTLSGNSATGEGGGLYSGFGATATIANSIIWNNEASGVTNAVTSSISYQGTSTSTVKYSLIKNSDGSGAWNAAIGLDGGNNIDSDPLFITPISTSDAPTITGNLQLQIASPAINAGNTMSYTSPITIDVAGNDRIQNTIIDMGAYETDLPLYKLTTTTDGSGAGSIEKSPDAISYSHGTVVTLTATANSGSSFSGWMGDVSSSTNPLTVSVDQAKEFTATFTLNAYSVTLDTAGTGGGLVASSPTGPTHTYGTVVTLTATADIGSNFAGWMGDAGGDTNPITVTVDQSKHVTALFSLNSYTLTTTTAGSGSGSIDRSPDSPTYTHGTTVTLTASPTTGSSFTSWSDVSCGTTVTCTVTMLSTQAITASFMAEPTQPVTPTIYLPLITSSSVPKQDTGDSGAEAITIANGELEITSKKKGDIPIIGGFWIDPFVNQSLSP